MKAAELLFCAQLAGLGRRFRRSNLLSCSLSGTVLSHHQVVDGKACVYFEDFVDALLEKVGLRGREGTV